MNRALIFIILFCVNFSANAQDKINGKVLEMFEDGSEEPIIGANVYWEGTTLGTITDVNGKFSISQLSGPSSLLSASYIGYTFESKSVIDNYYIFYLKKSIDLEEVKVSSQISTTKMSTLEISNLHTITSGEIQKAACCNLSECFETNNVVDVVYSDAVSGIKRIRMLGLDGRYIQITNELIPLVRGLQRSYGLGYIPGSWIESIQVIQGTGSVVNGFESFTGQINVEYFKPVEETDKLHLNIFGNASGKIENNLILSKKKGRWVSNLFTHFSYFDKELDNYGHNDGSGDSFIDMPKFKQFTALNRWQYNSNNDFRFQINFRGLIEERSSGQFSKDVAIFDNLYNINNDNKIFQIYKKIGKIYNENRSIGSQTSFTFHNQKAKFGNNLYAGLQESFSINIVEQNQLNNKHLLKYGGSYLADRFTESFEGNNIQYFSFKKRVDLVTGLFSEYQYQDDNFNFIGGLRADYFNNAEKIFYSPRFNAKYNTSDNTAIRFSAGQAFRISNFISENMNYLASSREIIFDNEISPEIAFNYGFNIVHCFYLFNNTGNINVDFYNTFFENQIVVNIENAGKISFGNLEGNSFSKSINFGLDYSLIDQIQIRLGYKIINTISTYDGKEKEVPLNPQSRGLINLSYRTISDKWHFDFTANYVGKSRIPEFRDEDDIVIYESYSPVFILLNTQLTHKWDNFDLYIGGENLSNYTQPNPIIDSENPFGQNFDASLIWGPVMGRTIYAGMRYNIR